MKKIRFEWAAEKDKENQKKHGMPFLIAQRAFLDPHRIIVEDIEHSTEEDRYYCIGRVGEGGERLSAFTVRDIGVKERKHMKSKIKYSDEPIGKLKVIDDFLPPPEHLVLKEDNIKVTIALKKSSVEFFKKEAKKHHTSYQKMIRQLVDWYTSHHQKSA